jgi:hypothetical protein
LLVEAVIRPIEALRVKVEPVKSGLVEQKCAIEQLVERKRCELEKIETLNGLKALDVAHKRFARVLEELRMNIDNDRVVDGYELEQEKMAAVRVLQDVYRVQLDEENSCRVVNLLEVVFLSLQAAKILEFFKAHIGPLERFVIAQSLKSSLRVDSDKLDGLLEQAFMKVFDYTRKVNANHELRGKVYSICRDLVVRILSSIRVTKGAQFAEDVLKTEIVVPLIQGLLKKRLPADASFKQFYDSLILELRQNFQFFLELSHEVDEFNFFPNSIWSAVAECMIQLGTSVFTVGLPDQFHVNYNAFSDFLDEFIALAPNQASANHVRNHEKYSEIFRKWNIRVYLRLRTSNAFKIADEAFKIPLTDNIVSAKTSESGQLFVSNVFRLLWKSIDFLWDSKVWILELTPDLLLANLKIFKKLVLWIGKGIGVSSKASKDPSYVADWNLKSEHLLIGLLSDAVVLQSKGLDLLKENIQSLPKLAKTYQYDLIQKAFSISAIELFDVSKGILDFVSKRIVTSLSPSLKEGIANIKTAYSVSSSHKPEKASGYMKECTTRLVQVFQLFQSYGIIIEDSQRVFDYVLSSLLEIFQKDSEELLESIRKTASVLMRLQSQKSLFSNLIQSDKPGSSSSSSNSSSLWDNASDFIAHTEKIQEQVRIDLEEILSCLSLLGIDSSVHSQRIESIRKSIQQSQL